MKRVLFLLATIMASLPLWAAEEEDIYLDFTTNKSLSGAYSKKGDASPVRNVYTSKIWATNTYNASGACFSLPFPSTSTSATVGGKGDYSQVEKFTIDLNNQTVYTISFSPKIYSGIQDKYALCCSDNNDVGLAVYGRTSTYKSFCPTIKISSDDPTEYLIKKVEFGRAVSSTSEAFVSGDEGRGLINVTNGVKGIWSYDYSSNYIVFTPSTPQQTIEFKATSYNGEILRLGHIGIVRDAKKPAPKLKRQAATTYPMLVNNEFCFVGESVDVEFETTSGTDYVYTLGTVLPTIKTTTKLQNSKITVSGLNAGETKTINVAAIEDDKKDVGFVRTVVCRRMDFPKVDVASGYQGYDATSRSLSYLEEEGQIKIARPEGIETVYYTLDGFDPTDGSHRVLPADGIIKLPPAVVGQTTTLKLVAVCGSYYGEVTTIRCLRASVAAPVIEGYTTDFTLQQSGQNWNLQTNGKLLTDFAANGVIIGSNSLLVRLTSAYTAGSGPFLEAQISDSPQASASASWSRLTPAGNAPNAIVFDTEKNLNLSGDGFIGSGRNECWLHLRAVSPTATGTAASEPVALHILKAKPAQPGKPAVTQWTESSGLNFIYHTVRTNSLRPIDSSSSLEIEGDELLLRLGSDYGSAEGQFIQFLLSTDPQPAAQSDWNSRDYEVMETADGEICKDLLILSCRDGSANINDRLFPSGSDGKRPTEIYLHLRAVTTPDETDYNFVASETTSLRLVHRRPSSPEIKLNSAADVKPNLTRYINSITAKITPVSGTGQYLQYAFAEYDGNSWPGSEPAQWELADGSQDVTIESNGRLYARQYDPVYDQAGETVIMDFEKVTAAKIHIGDWPDVESNSLVQIDEPLKVMGCYMTRAATAGSVKTAYVYLVDGSGNTLKMVVSGEETALRSRLQSLGYFSFGQTVDLMIPKGGVTGRLSKTVTDDDRGLWPELLVTPTTGESYLSYLKAAANGQLDKADGYYTDQIYADKNGDNWTSKPRTTIDIRRDFARRVEFRSLEWLGAKNRMRTDDGMELTLYNRLDVSATGYEFDADVERLVKGKLYKVTGYVGQLNGELALFPIAPTLECPATPRLYAPNLIDGTPDENGFIEARAISTSIRIVIEGAAGASFSYPYKAASSPVGLLQTSDFYASADGSFTIQLAEGETKYIAVYGQLNNMTSVRPAMVAITRYHADPVGSIADFKKLERERRQAPDYDGSERYYQLDGEAVIRMATPYYLYVSDTDEKAGEQPADRYLLIYNENGWTNPQFADGGETRSLQAGDVIRDFALVGHDGMKLSGNIISNSTGFARTYKYAGRKVDPAAFEPTPVEINYVDPASDSYCDNVGFGEDQRMTYVQLRNVRVSRTGSSEADYAYTLDIKGDPALTFDVFPRTQGWHTMWKAGEGFTITGVVVRDDKADGATGYAFAPTAFEAANSVGGQLAIEFDGQGDEREGMQYFVQGDAVLSYTPAEGETFVPTIYYTTDGSDPRNNVEGRIKASGAGPVRIPLTADVVIRAFVAAPGLNPGAEVSRTFRNSVNEVQYILNFLRAGREHVPYRFTSKLRVVAAGGSYLFLAGPVGHFLPVYSETAWNPAEYPAGSYLQHLLVEKRTDAHGNVMAEATGYTTPGVIGADQVAPGERISVTPDEVEELTVASARRLVTIRNVTVRASEAGAAAPFMVTPLDGSHAHPLMDGTLGKVLIRETDASGQTVDTDLGFADGEAYDITGFVMLGEPVADAPEGGVELWPVVATHLTRTPAVSIGLQDALTLTMTAENEYMARFGDVAAVSISAGNVRGARIYYSFDNEEWFEYFRPIAVETSCMIHAKAIAPGMTESVHTHLTLEKAPVSGEVEFVATPAVAGGSTSVTLRPATRMNPSAPYEIYYTTDGSAPTLTSARYTSPFSLTRSSMVKAILVEEGMAPGAVGRAYITVADPVAPEQPSDPTVSGRVRFSLDDSDPARVLVKIEPDGAAAIGYEIYYTTEAGKVWPDGWIRYDKPFDVTESTLVMAVLVENGKKPGAVAEVSVWVNPGVTGIDVIGADEATETVRVDGNTIVAPAGSRVYDISGRQVRPEGLRPGVYIVVTTDGRSVKVLVR